MSRAAKKFRSSAFPSQKARIPLNSPRFGQAALCGEAFHNNKPTKAANAQPLGSGRQRPAVPNAGMADRQQLSFHRKARTSCFKAFYTVGEQTNAFIGIIHGAAKRCSEKLSNGRVEKAGLLRMRIFVKPASTPSLAPARSFVRGERPFG